MEDIRVRTAGTTDRERHFPRKCRRLVEIPYATACRWPCCFGFMVDHLGPLVPCSESTTPNIAPAAAPPARTGASDLNPNAPTFVGSAHGQGDDGSNKVRYIPLT